MKPTNEHWLRKLLSGRPHHVVGEPGRIPYLLRWYLWPRNRWLNFYLHCFLRDDDDRALHDHPWWFLSLVLKGAYREVLPGGKTVVRRRWSLGYRPAVHRHRVELTAGSDLESGAHWIQGAHLGLLVSQWIRSVATVH